MVQQTEISQCDTHINKRKEKKKNTIFSVHVEKAVDKIQHPLTVIKKIHSHQSWYRGTISQHNKSHL